MEDQRYRFGIVGLGRIGGGLAQQALEKGMDVVGYDPAGASDELVEAGLREVGGYRRLADELSPPRVVFLYVPAGPVVDTVLRSLEGVLKSGDVVVDGGNSYWGDTIRRHERMAENGIRLVDAGTSGGVEGARRGACFMVGGPSEAVGLVKPILLSLSVEGGFVHAGPPGAGHFVKLVHNGIEFGMLQAIGEGVDLLESHHEKLPVADILGAWRNGSVIRSWLVDLIEEGYRREPLDEVPAYVEDTGEVNWLVMDALEMGRPVPVISQSVMQLLQSRDEGRPWARAVAMMRRGFGDHPYGPAERIRKERRMGRVGPPHRAPARREPPPGER